MAEQSGSGGSDGVSAELIRQLALAVRALRQQLNKLPPILFNLGDAARSLLRNPVKFILTTVTGFVVSVFIRPVFEGTLAVGTGVVLAVRELFVTLAGAIGAISGLLISGGGRLGSDVLRFVAEWNQAVARLVADAGLGALPIATLLWLVEAIAITYTVLVLVQIAASALGFGRIATGITGFISGVIP